MQEIVRPISEYVLDLIYETTEALYPKLQFIHSTATWVTITTRNAINTHIAAYSLGLQSGNMENDKTAAYNVRRAVKEAKKFQDNNS